ncbi:MAG: efflux RND transporter periplasmic adaptor subunit [Gemmataceae bacterium]
MTLRWVILLGLLFAAAVGCQRTTPQVAPADLPAVAVAHPVERVVTDYVDFTGRTGAVHSVNIVPRVTGYLTKMPFKEGSEVHKDDLLFEIDPRPYQAQYDQAVSQVSLYEAQLDLAKKTLTRYVELDKSTPGAVSKQELDQYRASVVEAEARVNASKKSLEVYQLNKDFTRVTSPIDGQVSRYYLTLGNLVNQDQTLLTTVVSLDPMYVDFDMDERTLVQIRQAIHEGRITPYGGSGMNIPLAIALPNETGFPHSGTVNFINNQVNSATGSISMRGIVTNPKQSKGPLMAGANTVGVAGGLGVGPLAVLNTLVMAKTSSGTGRLLSPGMFVRVRLPIGQPHPARLVIDRAIQSDQGLKYVYVVDSENKVQYRRVTTGALQPDGLRVIEPATKEGEGLNSDDLVVVGGLQQVRQRMEVRPAQGAMPSLAPGAARDAGIPADKGKGAGKTKGKAQS